METAWLEEGRSLGELLCQVRSDDVIGREWAVRELARFRSSPEVAEALTAIARADPFWAVRVAVEEVLAEGDPQAFTPREGMR